MNLLTDDFDFDQYLDQQDDERAKVLPASTWAEAVVDRFYGQGSDKHWTPTGFDKMAGKFDLRRSEVTLWAGINGHGKTTLLSQVLLQAMQKDQKPHTKTGARGRLIFETVNTHLRHELRKMFHGPILNDFSQQVRLWDPIAQKPVRYSPAVWKEHLKDLFCPQKFDDDGKPLPKSTELLSDDEFSEFLVEVQAYGVVDCGVTFTEKDH